jgi:hypothetical protein
MSNRLEKLASASFVVTMVLMGILWFASLCVAFAEGFLG